MLECHLDSGNLHFGSCFSITEQTNVPFGMQVLRRRDFCSPCKSRITKCPFDHNVALRHKCAKGAELMRNTEKIEEGEGCGHIQGLLFPVQLTSFLACTVAFT